MLERALRRWRKPAQVTLLPYGPEPPPRSSFDVQMRERVRGLENEIKEIKGRINGLIFLGVGAVIVQVVLRLVD